MRKITRPTKCSSCTLKSVCGMCPANGELENADPEEPVDWLCHTAHLRAMALDIEVTPHGDCEYCKGGSEHARLAESAARLRLGARTSEPPAPTISSVLNRSANDFTSASVRDQHTLTSVLALPR